MSGREEPGHLRQEGEESESDQDGHCPHQSNGNQLALGGGVGWEREGGGPLETT